MNTYFLSLLLIFMGLASACVSKKKHLAAIDTLKKDHETLLAQKTSSWERQLNKASKEIKNLELSLAERRGENNILLLLRNELQDSILTLERTIENLTLRSSSTQQNLNATLVRKEKEIARLNGLLNEVDQTLNRHVEMLGQVAGDLRFILQSLDANLYDIQTSENEVKVALTEEIIFVKGRTATLSKKSQEILPQISEVLQRYPNMRITVIGHTDNAPPRRRSDIDNWNISAIRATQVVRSLSRDFDLAPNRLLAAGKGEYSPMASNETADGRQKNRRIELIIAPRIDDLVRAIRQVLGK